MEAEEKGDPGGFPSTARQCLPASREKILESILIIWSHPPH